MGHPTSPDPHYWEYLVEIAAAAKLAENMGDMDLIRALSRASLRGHFIQDLANASCLRVDQVVQMLAGDDGLWGDESVGLGPNTSRLPIPMPAAKDNVIKLIMEPEEKTEIKIIIDR